MGNWRHEGAGFRALYSGLKPLRPVPFGLIVSGLELAVSGFALGCYDSGFVFWNKMEIQGLMVCGMGWGLGAVFFMYCRNVNVQLEAGLSRSQHKTSG